MCSQPVWVCLCVRIKRSQWWWYEASFGTDRRRHSLPEVISQGSFDPPSHNATTHRHFDLFFFCCVVLCVCGILQAQRPQWRPALLCLCAISGFAGKRRFLFYLVWISHPRSSSVFPLFYFFAYFFLICVLNLHPVFLLQHGSIILVTPLPSMQTWFCPLGTSTIYICCICIYICIYIFLCIYTIYINIYGYEWFVFFKDFVTCTELKRLAMNVLEKKRTQNEEGEKQTKHHASMSGSKSKVRRSAREWQLGGSKKKKSMPLR